MKLHGLALFIAFGTGVVASTVEELSCNRDFLVAKNEVKRLIGNTQGEAKARWVEFESRLDKVISKTADPSILGFACFRSEQKNNIKQWEKNLATREKADRLRSLNMTEGASMQLLEFNVTKEDYLVRVNGRVRNNGTKDLEYLKINYEAYDASGQIVDSGFTYVTPKLLKSNQSGAFKVLLDKNALNVKLTTWESN